jgi:CBS domain-containing protein
MPILKELLKYKGNALFFTTPQTLVYDALEIMADKDIGALLVMDAGKLVGIFTERDYARKVALKGRDSHKMLVEDLMTTKLYVVTPEVSLEDAMALMTAKRIRHLPVLVNHEVIGLISIGDIVRQVVSNQKILIEAQEKYIMGSY